MPFKRTPMRYAHTNGHTSCAYTEDGQTIITCGSDGDIRTWEGIDDDDPSSKCLGEFVLAVVQYEKRMLVSTDLNVVQAYTFPTCDRDGTEFRFTAAVTCIKVNKKFITAGSEDTEIKVKGLDKNDQEFVLSGHKGPILYIDLSVTDQLVSSSGDGTIKIWDLNEKKELKTITGLPKVNTFEIVKSLVSPCFDPATGKSLAYLNGKTVIILNTSSWEVKSTLSDDNVVSDYTCCAYSLCGQYLSAGTETGEISVWNVQKASLIKGETANRESHRITAIAWNPMDNGEFAYCDSTGQLGTVVECNGHSIDSEDFIASEAIEEEAENDFDGIQFVDDGDDTDADNENCISLNRLKNNTLKKNGPVEDEDSKDSILNSPRTSVDRVVTKTYTQQGPFQPGSTPSDLEHRYLVWNDVGIVRADTSDTEGMINVEFHDVSVHHALHMSNYLNHTMASLSSTVLALSSDSSKLVCIALGAIGRREWSFEFSDCESTVALAATNKLVAVATDSRYLRIFSVMGTQRQVISIPGPIVSVCGHEDKIFVAYHSAPASEDQHMTAMFIQFFGLNLRCKESKIPILRGKKLTWIGYSDRGSPVICDTMGIVQMFNMKMNCWQPVCDTMKHTQSVSNNFFIVAVLESSQIIQAILCRGASYPMTNPRPMVIELPMQIPLCNIKSEKSMFEETLIRYSSFNTDDSNKVMLESAIKLFALACRSEMEARGKELVETIASEQFLSLAVKYACNLGRMHLAQKLNELLPHIGEMEKEREKEMQDSDVEFINVLQNSPLNASLLLMEKNKPAPGPSISPKPMVISHQRRNPFKRTSTTSSTPSSTKANPLSHLTEKAIGFELKKAQQVDDEGITPLIDNAEIEATVVSDTQDTEVIPSSINNENKATNENTPVKVKFTTWFTANRENLKAKHPEVPEGELSKLAMKEYKLVASKSAIAKDAPVNGKRKFDDTTEEKQSGISKLAKYGFTK